MTNRLRLLIRGAAAALSLGLVTLIAAPAFAAPTLNVSQLTGLKDGQTLTISGSGFTPNLASIAIGQCVVGYKGPSDCNTAGGATFRNADGSGSVGSFTIVVKEKFGANDCSKVQCLIAAGPLLALSHVGQLLGQDQRRGAVPDHHAVCDRSGHPEHRRAVGCQHDRDVRTGRELEREVVGLEDLAQGRRQQRF